MEQEPKEKVKGDTSGLQAGNGDPYNFAEREGTANNIPYVSAPQVGQKRTTQEVEDGARKHIAYFLIGLLGFIVAFIFKMIADKIILVADIKDFDVVLGPIVTLVSAATGFYYGTKSNNAKL